MRRRLAALAPPGGRRWAATPPAVALLLSTLLAVTGCAGSATPSEASKRVAGPGLGVLADPVKLHGELMRILDRAYTRVVGLSSDVAANTSDRTVRERTFMLKVRWAAATEHIVAEPDPRVAYLRAWVLAEQTMDAVTGPDSLPRLGDGDRAVVVEFATNFQRDIVDLGRTHFGDEIVDRAIPEIDRLADSLPVSEHFVSPWTGGNEFQEFARSSSSGGTASSIMKIVSYPLSPFTGLQGVGDAPAAIREFTTVAGAFSTVVRQLPTRVRWEAELLLLELDSLPTLVQTRDSLARTTAAVESLSAAAAKLPEDVRREVKTILDESGEAQAQLRGTLEEARRTTESLRSALEGATATAESVRKTAGDLGSAAESFEKAAVAARSVLEAYERLASKEPSTPPPEGGYPNVRDYEKMAVELRRAGEEVRLLLDDVGGEKLSAALEKLGESARGPVDHTADRLDDLVDRITVRAAILLGAVLALVAAWTYLVRRRPGDGGASARPSP